jgi:hypothetical protein
MTLHVKIHFQYDGSDFGADQSAYQTENEQSATSGNQRKPFKPA